MDLPEGSKEVVTGSRQNAGAQPLHPEVGSVELTCTPMWSTAPWINGPQLFESRI